MSSPEEKQGLRTVFIKGLPEDFLVKDGNILRKIIHVPCNQVLDIGLSFLLNPLRLIDIANKHQC